MEKSSKTGTLTNVRPGDDASFFRDYTSILEMLVAGSPLPDILSHIATLVERQCHIESWCSISVLTDDQAATKLMAAPSAPEDFTAALNNLHVSETHGTCGKAIRSGKIAIVENIRTDSDHEVFRGLFLESGILASASLPVLGSNGKPIAVITNFYHSIHRADEREIRRIEDLGNLVSLAIAKTFSAHEIADSNIRFESVAATTNDAVWDWDIITDTLWWNDSFSKLFGFRGEGKGPSVGGWAERLHPEDRDRVYSSLRKATAGDKSHWIEEYRFSRHDGSIAHVLDQAEIIRDKSGKALRMIGGMRDMSAYAEAKQELTALNRSLEMLRACNRVLIHATDEKQLLTDICSVATEVGGYRMAWVGYADKGKDKQIVPAAHHGVESGYLDEIKLSYSDEDITGNGPAGRCLRSGQAIICEDIRKEDDFYWKSSAIQRGLLNVVCLPLKNSDSCFGFLSLMSANVSTTREDELKLLTELSENLAFGISSIRNRRHEETLRDAIFKVASSVSDTVGNRFYETLALDMTETFGAHAGIIGKISRGDETVNSLSHVLDGKVTDNISYSLSGTPCEQVESGDVCIYTDNIQTLFPDDHILVEIGAESYAGIALLDNENRRCGIISVLFREPIEDPSLVISILKIFAERAAAEMEREHAENLLVEQASLLDKARDAILAFDLDHGITYLNSSAEKLYGYNFYEAPGKSIRELLHEDTVAFDTAFNHTLEHGEWLGELRQIDKNKNPVIVESRWNLVLATDEDPPSILSINTDVTRHKSLEQAFFRAQRLESIGTLAGGIAHDLNNILTPISMSIELLRSSISDARGRELLDTIAHSSKRGVEMTSQILSFARGLENGQNSISGKELFDSVHGIIRDTFPKNISIKFTLPPGLQPINGDSTQLYQVLLNLCVNARDAMPDGGSLHLSAMNERIDLPGNAKQLGIETGSYVRIDVEDTGHGIPQEIQDKIYEPFFSTKETGKGSGLGLSTSLNIIKNHGGCIHAFSEPHRGTSFRLHLPALAVFDNTHSHLHSGENLALPCGNGETILLVDDEPEIVEMLAMLLERSGYLPLSATSGLEGSKIYAERNAEINAVITDMMMPKFDGASLIRQIVETNPHTVIIAASGIYAQKEAAKAAGCPPANFLLKPFSAEDILLALKRTLNI